MPWIANRGEGWAELTPPTDNTVIISITEPGRKARIPKGYEDILRLEFQDYDPVGPDHTGVQPYQSIPQRPKIPDTAVLFSRKDAAKISRFARKHREHSRNIVVHCAAGISRSGGVVEALLQAFPEYADRGWPRFPNGHVKATLKRAMGLTPIGA